MSEVPWNSEDEVSIEEVPTIDPEPAVDINKLAWEVLRGEHGLGQARRDSLGENYDEVSNEVLRIRLQNGNS